MTPEEKQRLIHNVQSLRQDHPDWPADRLMATAIVDAGIDNDTGMQVMGIVLKHAYNKLKHEHPDWPRELVHEALRVRWGMVRGIEVAK
jgi:hypothetical protein